MTIKINKPLALLCVLLGCQSKLHSNEVESVVLYNDVLEQIISDKYWMLCIPSNEAIERIHDDFREGRIDSARYARLGDSIKVEIGVSRKCHIDYGESFQIHGWKGAKESMAQNLQDPFLATYFAGVSIDSTIDTLSLNSKTKANDLEVNYLNVVPHIRNKFKPFGVGIGVIGFSRIYFNEVRDKAIVYYEFEGGPKFGVGEILFLERVIEGWKIIRYQTVWQS